MIKLENVSFQYAGGKEDCVHDLSLAVRQGELVLLLGESGCGKTTVTRLVNRLAPAFFDGKQDGRLYIGGECMNDKQIQAVSKLVGSVFQDPRSQFFTTEVMGELAFACENAALPREEIVCRVENCLKTFRLEHLRDRSLFTLSSGEKQLVAVASVYAGAPPVLVLDEPSANLDMQATWQLRDALQELKNQGFTIVISEHRIHYLRELADHAFLLDGGKITHCFDKDELESLTNEQTAALGLRCVIPEALAPIHKPAKTAKAAGMEPLLFLAGIGFAYPGKETQLEDVNVNAHAGEIIGIVGNNGAGKTTLLEIICGLQQAGQGKVLIGGREADPKKRRQSTYMVMQDSDYQLFSDSVLNELLLEKAGNTEDEQKAREILARLELSEFEEQHPASLSGGQKQRLCIAVACMNDASVICLDEPTSGLDYNNMLRVQKMLRQLADSGKAILLVSHDFEFLLAACDRVLHLRDARLAESFELADKKDAQRLWSIMDRDKAAGEGKEEKMKNEKKSWLGTVFGFAGRAKGKVAASVLFALLSVASSMVPYISAYQIIRMFFTGTAQWNDILLWALVCFAGFLGKAVFHAISTTLSHVTAYTILENIRLHIADKLRKAPLGVVQGFDIGKLKNIVIDHVETIELPLAHLIPEGFASFVLPAVVFVYLCAIDWRLALASIITVPLAAIPYGIMMKGWGKSYDSYMAQSNEVNSVIVEYTEGIEVIKAFSQSTSSYEKFKKAVSSFRDETLRWYKSTWATRNLGNAILPSVLLGVLPIGMALYLGGSVQPAELTMAMLLALGIVASLTKFTTFVNNTKSIEYAVQAVNECLELPELADPKEEVPQENQTVAYEQVGFSYSGDMEDAVLQDINFTMREGSFTALVGPSGGGKSTVARLLARFWDVGSGSITLGGVDIRQMPMNQLMQSISYVTQDTYLFNDTILENIRLGNPKASDDKVLAAAKAAQCDDFIAKLENGYHTRAGDAGKKLSGGEKQRIAIARMILKNAPIVLLDEATAFTDPENEEKLQESISNLTKGKTLLVIAHRLSTIKNADQILVIEKGRITAQGTHKELLASSTTYQSMWQAHIGTENWVKAASGKERAQHVSNY